MSTTARDNGAAGDQVPGGGAAGREIAAVGHADLTPRTFALVESAFQERLKRLERLGRHVEPGSVMVRCGAGAPVALGRAASASAAAWSWSSPRTTASPPCRPGTTGWPPVNC